MGRCWGLQRRGNSSVKQMKCSSERIGWATDGHGAFLMAWLAVSEVVATVCEVAVALDTVLEVVGVDVCAVATAVDSSGHETRGCGTCRGAVGRSGNVCRHF
jgi:hypothetical protein